jgi:glycerol uptake facilitator-like aquaporin
VEHSAGRVDASSHLSQRLIAEGIGTGFLVVAVIGSGIMATRLTTDTAIQLLANAAATAGALIALIWTFQNLSGAHLNPVVTLVDRLAGVITTGEALAYVCAQIFGGCIGAMVANAMLNSPSSNAPPRFDRPVGCGSARSSPRSGCYSSSAAVFAPDTEMSWPSRSACGSAVPTGSPQARASPTPP